MTALAGTAGILIRHDDRGGTKVRVEQTTEVTQFKKKKKIKTVIMLTLA